jgi:DNA-directed RNA polymerase alpha subunit
VTDQAPAASLPDETPVEELPLRPVERNALLAGGLRTLGDLRATPDRELLRLRHFGPHSLADVWAPVPAPDVRGTG